MHGNRLHGIYLSVNANDEIFGDVSGRIHSRCVQLERLGLRRYVPTLDLTPQSIDSEPVHLLGRLVAR